MATEAVDQVVELLGELGARTIQGLEVVEWCEDEIEKACVADPAHADLIWHSFSLMKITDVLHPTEFVIRSHCQELLRRVVAGTDTRFGTAAEVCGLCAKISEMTPLNVAATGLYMRMWKVAGFPPEVMGDDSHHEALKGSAIDEFEREARRKLSQSWRKLPAELEHRQNCPGWHDHCIGVLKDFLGHA